MALHQGDGALTLDIKLDRPSKAAHVGYPALVALGGELLLKALDVFTDPINNRYRYKLGKGLVEKTGESEFKSTMSFAPRNLA